MIKLFQVDQALQSGLKQYASKYSEFDQGVGSLKTGVAATLTVHKVYLQELKRLQMV